MGIENNQRIIIPSHACEKKENQRASSVQASPRSALLGVKEGTLEEEAPPARRECIQFARDAQAS
jgi:hypothetical protein